MALDMLWVYFENSPTVGVFFATVLGLLGIYLLIGGFKFLRLAVSKEMRLVKKMNEDELEELLIDIFFRRGYKVRKDEILLVEKRGISTIVVPEREADLAKTDKIVNLIKDKKVDYLLWVNRKKKNITNKFPVPMRVWGKQELAEFIKA